MPWIAYHTAGLPDSDIGGDPLRPLIRNVDVQGVSRSVLCGGFVSNENVANVNNAIAQYVAAFGGAAGDWTTLQLPLPDWQAVESAIFQPVRDLRQQQIDERKNDLRTGFGQHLKQASAIAGTDLVLIVPPAGAARQEFLRSLRLLIVEALDPVFGD